MQLDEIKTFNKDFIENANVQTVSTSGKTRRVIEFHNVGAKWPVISVGNDEKTLSDISFEILPGQFLSVIGKVGCGKVSL